jgi:hypothetical protein
MKDLSEATVEAATQSTEHKRDDKENERNKKYDFRDADGSAGNSTEAQKAGNQGDYEKRNNKVQHDHSPSMRRVRNKNDHEWFRLPGAEPDRFKVILRHDQSTHISQGG